MNPEEIIKDLNEQIQMLEDLKTTIIELQEETYGMIMGVKNWFEQQERILAEAKRE